MSELPSGQELNAEIAYRQERLSPRRRRLCIGVRRGSREMIVASRSVPEPAEADTVHRGRRVWAAVFGVRG